MAAAKTILITGSSTGIGRACAEHLARQGHQVYGTVRKPPEAPLSFPTVPMDVTNEESVGNGIAQVVRSAGRLDVLINNAGMGYLGSVEETSIEEARRQFDINVFGVLRVCRAALPVLRRQGSGLIVNVSSIGGVIGLPFEGLYSASKFALEGMSEALRLEVRPFGIHVALVEPGDIRSDFPKNRIRTRESGASSAYGPALSSVLEVMAADEARAPSADLVARLVGRIVARKSPALRHRVGIFHQRLAAWAKGFLPAGLFEAILRSAYKM